MNAQRNVVIPLPTRKMTYLPVGLILGAALAFGINSMAENTELDSGPRVFPYNGVLELDGTGFTGQADFQFTLTDDESCSYIESHDAVTVSGGRFSVNIGGVDSNANPLPVCVFDSEQMFIQIAVREGGDNQPHRALTGRQRIHPVPFAYWAAEGSDFKVDGDINVAGGNLNMNGGSVNAGNGGINGVNAISGFNGAPISFNNDLNASGRTITTQHISGLSSLNAGGGAITAGGNFTANGNATVGGNLTMDGLLTINNNVAEPNLIDQDTDFQLRLFTGNSPSTTYGMGIQPSTMFFNVSDSARYRFFENGNTILMDLAQNGAAINASTTVNGGLTVTSGTNLRGVISNSTGDVTINDDVRVNGTLMRVSLNREMPDNQNNFADIDRDLSTNGTQTLPSSRNFCFIADVRDLNSDNNHRCSLRISGGDWQYSSNEGNCRVICYGWD